MVQANSINYYSPARWVVTPTAGQGTHTTIAGALTSSSSGDTIVIMPGSYTENLTLKAGVNLVSFSGDGDTPNVTIIGKASFSSAGTVTISNIRLQTTSDNFLAVTGSAASIVNLEDCYLNATNNTGISFTTASTSAKINVYRCLGDLGTTGIGMHSSSSTGAIAYSNCFFTNSGASLSITSNSAGSSNFSYCTLTFGVGTTSTGGITVIYTSIANAAINTIAITANGSGSSYIAHSDLTSGTASAITIGTGAGSNVNGVRVSSSNTNAITGAGTINIDGIFFDGSSNTINTTTVANFVFTGGSYKGTQLNTAPAAGMIGQRIEGTASSVATTSTTAKTITSISLTAGIWDVSAQATSAATGGAAVMTVQLVGISTTDNTIEGTLGIQYAQTNITAISVCSNSVPAFRVSLSATTTYYLVVQNFYTSTTCPTNARLSATRVA